MPFGASNEDMDRLREDIDNSYKHRTCPYCGQEATRIRDGWLQGSYECPRGHTFTKASFLGHALLPVYIGWKILGGGDD